MPIGQTIVGIGEALYDVIAGESRLGGAPLNVAVHANQLARVYEGRAVVVSRVGQDDLGKRLLDELGALGQDTSFIQSDPDFATGRVFVRFGRGAGGKGSPHYEIVANAAWDMLWFDPDDEDLAVSADAICFGSLAQRSGQARNSIYRFLDASRHSVKLFDLNLRSGPEGRPFYDQRVLERSCERANVVKANLEELAILTAMLGLPVPEVGSASGEQDAVGSGQQQANKPENAERLAAGELIERFELEMVVLTRGEAGTRLFLPASDDELDATDSDPDAEAEANAGQDFDATPPEASTSRPPHGPSIVDGLRIIDGQPASYAPAESADSVGAGDACAAAILVGLTRHLDPQRIADLANQLGAYVASVPGGTPALPESITARLANDVY